MLLPAEEREAATSESQEQLAQDKANAAKMVHEAIEGTIWVVVPSSNSGRWMGSAGGKPCSCRIPSAPIANNQHACLLQGGKDLSEPELARALAHESREAAAVSPGARRS